MNLPDPTAPGHLQPSPTRQGTMVLPISKWPVVRIIHTPPHNAIESAAGGEALLRFVREPVITIVREFTEPKLSIGYFQSWRDVPPGRGFVRRLTGGSLMDPEPEGFSISTMVPPEHPRYWMERDEQHITFNGAIGQAIRDLGHPVTMAVNAPDFDPIEGSNFGGCFDDSFKFDLVDGTRKLVACAVHRRPTGCMQEARVHVPGSNKEKLIEAVVSEMIRLFGVVGQNSDLTPSERTYAEELAIARYQADAWNKMR